MTLPVAVALTRTAWAGGYAWWKYIFAAIRRCCSITLQYHIQRRKGNACCRNRICTSYYGVILANTFGPQSQRLLCTSNLLDRVRGRKYPTRKVGPGRVRCIVSPITYQPIFAPVFALDNMRNRARLLYLSCHLSMAVNFRRKLPVRKCYTERLHAYLNGMPNSTPKSRQVSQVYRKTVHKRGGGSEPTTYSSWPVGTCTLRVLSLFFITTCRRCSVRGVG